MKQPNRSGVRSEILGQAGLSTDYISSCAEISETDNNSRIR